MGLSIARQLAARDGTSTLLIERNGGVGMETSSRNSEVSFTSQQMSSQNNALFDNSLKP